MSFIESASTMTTSNPPPYRQSEAYVLVDGNLQPSHDPTALQRADRVFLRHERPQPITKPSSTSTTSQVSTISAVLSSTSIKKKGFGKVRQWIQDHRFKGELEFYLQPRRPLEEVYGVTPSSSHRLPEVVYGAALSSFFM